MSESNSKTFFELYKDGHAMEDEVDDYIDLWHDSKPACSLSEYLGLTDEEYSIFLTDASALPFILLSRQKKQPLQSVLAQRLQELTVAARSSDKTTEHAIKLWLKDRLKRS